MLTSRNRRLLTALLATTFDFGVVSAATSLAAEPETESVASVRISGAGLAESAITARELADLPRISIEAEDHGVRARFEGVALSTLLVRAGAPIGEKLRGSNLTLVLAVDAADGYLAVFALPELDPAFTDKIVILADRREGKPLSATEGPFRVIAVDEKRQGRWVRQVTSLRLIAVSAEREGAAPKNGQ